MGYKIMIEQKPEDRLDRERILDMLGYSTFSRNIILHETIGSTNQFTKELAMKGAPEGTLVLTEEQSAGRGRMDRKWLSPGYKNLLFSILLRPALQANELFVLTMILALAVIDGIKGMTNIHAGIKWPNDLYIENRKLGGILTEFSLRGRNVEYVVLGLGLNVNWNPEEEEGILYPSTSILAESGREVSRNELLIHIVKAFEGYYKEAVSGNTERLYRKWNDLSIMAGREVHVESKGEIIRGTAIRIDPSGALIIRDDRGEEHAILSGDVSLT